MLIPALAPDEMADHDPPYQPGLRDTRPKLPGPVAGGSV